MMKDKNKFYSLEKTSDFEADLYIYGDIVSYRWDEGDVSAESLKKEVEALGDISKINVHINSLGGSTFQGLAIYNYLKQHKATIDVYIDGIAASSASIIAMAGDHIYIPKTALMMIHNCWTYAIGNAEELRKIAEDMDKVAEAYKSAYISKINITKEKLEELLADETYLTAEECIEMGFADEILEVDEGKSINSFGNMAILNLVNRLKAAESKNQASTKEKSYFEKIVKDTLQECMDEILKEFMNGVTDNSQEPVGLINSTNKKRKDGWTSFFNTKK